MQKISIYKNIGLLCLFQILIACSSTTYTKYSPPETGPMINLTVDSQITPSSYLKQESEGFFNTIIKYTHALNSITIVGNNSGITSIDDSYLDSPSYAYSHTTITPGKHKLGIAAFLSGDSGNFYDSLEYDFKPDVNYIVRIEPHDLNSIKTTLFDADTNTILISSK